MRQGEINLREKIYSSLFYVVFLKKIGIKLLNSPRFVNNSLYQYLQEIYINKVIKKYYSSPNLVVIENTSFCNSSCSMCPHSVMRRKQGTMKTDLFRKIIDQCNKFGVKQVGLHNFGEPLMDKDFIEKVRYATQKKNFCVGTSTNAALMGSEIAKEIILSGLDTINFSIDAFTKSSYEKIRVGLPFEEVIKNVENFIDIRKQLSRKKPEIIVDFIETELNKGEKELFINKWKGQVDKVNITTLHAWGGSYEGKAGKGKFHSKLLKIKREPCRFLWTDMVINWDGRVSACCQDYEAKMVIGDINKNTLQEIWQGKIINDLRKKHLAGKFCEIPLCSRCNYRSVWWLFK